MIGEIVASRFEVLSYLGGGGYGSVWRVRDFNMDRECALKVFHTGTAVFQAFFEAQLLYALESPYVLRVHDADTFMDVAYMSTALAIGSAEDRMGEFGVPARDAIRWMRDALVGLDVCHRRRLLHRDIKPSNIFLQREDRAQLGDFGVATLLDDDGLASPHGDPLVRAPEMLTEGIADVRSDVYSAGVSLFTLLAGMYPFDGEGAELETRILAQECEPLADLAPHLPRKPVDCVQRAMRSNTDDRYQTAEAFSIALSRVPRIRVGWQRHSEHSEHFACWTGDRLTSSGGFAVCVVDTGKYEILTTRGPSKRRMREHCRVVAGPRLDPALRRIFRALQR